MTNLLKEWSPSLPEWFRDEAQLKKVRGVIEDRFACIRYQDECRYLMRLWWHFDMGYQEVSYEELLNFVTPSKMNRLNVLFDFMFERDYDEIDSWAEAAISEMELTLDR